MDFWQTEYTESMKNIFLMLYPVLGLLGAKGGRWDAEMEAPNVRKSPQIRRCQWNWVGFRGNSIKQMIKNPLARCSEYCSKFQDVHRPWLWWDRVGGGVMTLGA